MRQIIITKEYLTGLTFSVTKCKAINITFIQNLEELQLQLLGTPMLQNQHFHYLGVWVDASLLCGFRDLVIFRQFWNGIVLGNALMLNSLFNGWQPVDGFLICCVV